MNESGPDSTPDGRNATRSCSALTRLAKTPGFNLFEFIQTNYFVGGEMFLSARGVDPDRHWLL